jgi:NAD(P)-dependent dehydrogenase (short-subunit alcohol dehydrogenase family)
MNHSNPTLIDTDIFNPKARRTMGRLADKNILITGGNSGIGLATAREFDREGARVAICGLNERTLQAAKETLGAGSLAVRADVSKLADLDTMFATIKREFGHLDGLFVNAGYSEFLPFEEVTEQSFDMVIGSNFKGAYFTIQKALSLLRPGSSVVINASVGARKGWPTTSTVSTCKAAVVHLARILSAELVGRGIRVNTLSPGPTDTAMFSRFAGEERGDAVKGVLATNNPSKRMADPSEIAKLAVYLASDDSVYVVGADFLIDGGVTAISAVGA